MLVGPTTVSQPAETSSATTYYAVVAIARLPRDPEAQRSTRRDAVAAGAVRLDRGVGGSVSGLNTRPSRPMVLPLMILSVSCSFSMVGISETQSRGVHPAAAAASKASGQTASSGPQTRE